MKLLSVVGARPEFIQAAPISRALRADGRHCEVLVHTGQHYGSLMSQTFFDELGLPAPDYNLGVGSGSHGEQTAALLVGLERVLACEQPDLVIVRGDTNSTLAAALAAAKVGFPTAHIEAGERSYDRHMPEEINRLVTDELSELHLCASHTAVKQLALEGITGAVHWVGDVMLDVLRDRLPVARRTSHLLQRLNLTRRGFALVTVHRAANTDMPERLSQILTALDAVDEPIVFPVHPRTRKALAALSLPVGDHIHLIEPVGYYDMLMLEENARLIATDSGGVQREAYFLSVPCLTLREETEWIETVWTGWNRLVGTDPQRILAAWRDFAPPIEAPPIFGDGNAAARIVEVLSAAPVAVGGRDEQKREQAGRRMAQEATWRR